MQLWNILEKENQINMEKLLTNFKTKKDFTAFCKLLSDRIIYNQPISENPMIDGTIISYILTTNFAMNLFLQTEMGNIRYGTSQKLEQIVIWCTNNEEKLCQIIEMNKWKPKSKKEGQ